VAGEATQPAAMPVAQAEAADAPVVAAPMPAAAFIMPEAMPLERWSDAAVAATPADAKPVTAEVVAPLVAAVQMQEAATAPTADTERPALAEPALDAVAPAIAAPQEAVAESKANGFDLSPLMARLSQRPVMAFAPTGRMIVLMESEPFASDGLPAALADAFGRTGSVLMVDLGREATGEIGFTDVVSGEADFVEAIRADGPGGAHRVAAGLTETGVLFDDPAAVAFALEAMAEVYEWVVCRLGQGEEATELLALVSTLTDSVVIASNADPANETLADLYAVASDAGAGQVLIVQDRPVAEAAPEKDDRIAEASRIAA
jgi:polysaccharide biosynthesis transport protein